MSVHGNTVPKHTLVLCGGGLDSYVAAWDAQLANPTERTMLLYVDYGAKATDSEIRATMQLRTAMNARFGEYTCSMIVIESSLWSKYLTSPLTSNGTLINRNPRSGVAHEWVPARNTVLMAMALAIAENEGFARIVCGINKTAAKAYPDNSTHWLDRFQSLSEYALDKGRRVILVGPLAFLEKREIVDRAHSIGMTQEILEHSWSCYDSGKLHCGECSSCRARKQAFRESVWFDPTKYLE